jgi:hypothetical protein
VAPGQVFPSSTTVGCVQLEAGHTHTPNYNPAIYFLGEFFLFGEEKNQNMKPSKKRIEGAAERF